MTSFSPRSIPPAGSTPSSRPTPKQHDPATLAAFLSSLSTSAGYKLTTPSVRHRVRYSLNSFAHSHASNDSDLARQFLPVDDEVGPWSVVRDDWTLSSAQAAATAHLASNSTSASASSSTVLLGDEYSPSRRGKPCGHVFRPGESVYRCRTCGVDSTCVLCAKCFHASGHVQQGHDVTMSVHSGVGAGCCDCGDVEAWKEGRQTECKFHAKLERDDEPGPERGGAKGKERATDLDEVDEQARERAKRHVEIVVRGMFDWALAVFERSPEDIVAPKRIQDITGTGSARSGAGPSRSLPGSYHPDADEEGDEQHDEDEEEHAQGPDALVSAATRTLDEALLARQQVILNQLMREGTVTPADGPFAAVPAAPPAPRLQPASAPLDPNASTATVRPDASITTNATSSSSSSSSRANERPSVLDAQPPFAITLWNDERHSFTEVINVVSRAIGCSRRAASDVAQRVDVHGRDVVLVTPTASEALRVARTISAIDLAVSVRSAQQTFEEDVAGEVVLWMLDLLRVRVGDEGGALGEVVARVWLEQDEVDRDGGEQGKRESRFMRLAKIESRLWKEVRKAIQETCVGLTSVGAKVKAELSVQYAAIYRHLANAYLLHDREPENSLIFFGVQVFTVPSVCVALIRDHHFVSTLLDILYAFFTEQTDPPRPPQGIRASPTSKPRRLLAPNHAIRTVDPESPAFKQKRYFQLFSDLNHLISSPAAQRLLTSQPLALDHLERLTSFLALFTGMNPNVRAVGTHVEYESDAWVSAFNVTIQLGKLCRAYGEAFGHASTSDLEQALCLVFERLVSSDGPPKPTHRITLNRGVAYESVEFDVSSEKVSFHHPLTWLWAEMIKSAGKLERGLSNLQSANGPIRHHSILYLQAMEPALRAIVLVAQIRAGLWVRNGFGVRAQQLHYKEYSLRENTYDQDLLFLQSSLVVVEPSVAIAAILDRFDLRSWLVLGRDDHRAYDSSQAMSMTEELLTLLITLVSDPTYTRPLEHDQALERELVHHLALGPCVYSDLLRRVSERFGDDPTMDALLARVAHFKHPSGTNDQGTYSLRDDLYNRVDPYFPRYTRNQREEVDKIVRERLKKRSGPSSREPVIVPRPLAIEHGPFVNLAEALASPVLQEIVYYALKHGRSRGPLFSEVVVDQALQLATLALVEPASLDKFVEFARTEAPVEPDADDDADLEADEEREADEYVPKGRATVEPDESTLIRLLVKVEEDERMKAVQHKAAWILDELQARLGDEVGRWRKQSMVSEEDEAKRKSEERRLAAKKRQEAIMQQFAKAQSAFLESVEDEEDDDDEFDEFGEARMDDDDDMDGKKARSEVKPKVDFGSCIVCQDELEESAAFGLLGLVQGSNLIRLTPTGTDNVAFQEEILATPADLDVDATPLRPIGVAAQKVPVHSFDESGDGLARGFPQNQKSGFHVSSCGHLMHLSCFETYCSSLAARHRQQPTRCHPETIERREFVCPLCKSLGNVLLPVTNAAPAFLPYDGDIDGRSLAEWTRPENDPSLVVGEPTPIDDVLLARVDRLQLLSDIDHSNAFKPWRISLALPSLLPQRFSEREGVMVGRFLQVVTALRGEIGGPGGGLATLPKDVLGYTVSAIEISSRGTAEPAWKIGDANLRLLQSLFSTMGNLADLMAQSADSRRLAGLAIRSRLGGAGAQGSKFASIAFTDLDPLGSLVETAAIMPSAFYQVAAISFYTFLAQSLLGCYRLFHQSSSLAPLPGDALEDAKQDFVDLAQVKRFFPSVALFEPDVPAFTSTLGRHLHAQVVPFLRRASILARAVFGEPSTPPPAANGEKSSEYHRLLALLHIPPPSAVLRESETGTMTDDVALLQAHLRACAASATYLEGSNLLTTVDQLINSSAPEIEHPVIYEPLGLPHQLDTLLASTLERKCARCDTNPENPALCLLCGELVCCQSFCCMAGEDEAQHGECNEHMWTCGGSIGIYFLVKRNAILYLHTDKGAFVHPPYLDSHGEVDTGGRRTRSQFPQYLHRARYDEIRKVWLQQTVPTLVARKLEASTDHGGWTTM
ncbi:hypothetical protein JCM10212_006591 [Sporobolomyces blumeae]